LKAIDSGALSARMRGAQWGKTGGLSRYLAGSPALSRNGEFGIWYSVFGIRFSEAALPLNTER